MSLTPQEIEQVANLARLELTDHEKNLYANELSAVFSFIDQLGEVPTDDVPETCQVTGLMDVTRADEAENCSEEVRKKLIAQFPEKSGVLLRVPAVFEE